MAKNKEARNQANERRLLKQYLTRYYRLNERQAILQTRLAQLRHDLRRNADVDTSEIEAEIQGQAERAKDAAKEIIAILDLLPPYSIGRAIVEYRHIDCREWLDIQETLHMTASPCYDQYNRALDYLLRCKEVRAALKLDKRFSKRKNAEF